MIVLNVRARGLKMEVVSLIQREIIGIIFSSTLIFPHNSYPAYEYNSYIIFYVQKHFYALYYVVNYEFDLWIFQFPSNYFVNAVTGNLPVEH